MGRLGATATLVVTLAVGLGCGARSQLDVSGDAAIDTAADVAPILDSSFVDREPPSMRCMSDDSFAFLEGTLAGESFFFESGFSGGRNAEDASCVPVWILVFTSERCIERGVVPLPSLSISIGGPPLFASGVSYEGVAVFSTETAGGSFVVEVVADELSPPDAGGRARGFVLAEDFGLFAEFDLPMDPGLADLPPCE